MTRLLAILLASRSRSRSCWRACGSDDDGGGSATAPPEPAAPATAADFPSAQGKTLAQITDGLEQAAIIAPSSAASQKPGSGNRFGFVVVDTANKQIEVAAVAVYTSRPTAAALRGPFVARRESLDVADAVSQRADRIGPRERQDVLRRRAVLRSVPAGTS